MSQTQTGRVGVDAGIAEPRRRATPPRRVPRHKVHGARRSRAAERHGGARFLTGVVMLVAVATAAFGVEAYVRAGRDQSRIAALQANVSGLQQRLAADERSAAGDRQHVRNVAAQANNARRALARFSWALQSVPSEAQVAAVRNELAAYAACIPQLQSEIAGLGISWKIDPVKASSDYFKLSTAAPISASCSSALTGR